MRQANDKARSQERPKMLMLFEEAGEVVEDALERL